MRIGMGQTLDTLPTSSVTSGDLPGLILASAAGDADQSGVPLSSLPVQSAADTALTNSIINTAAGYPASSNVGLYLGVGAVVVFLALVMGHKR
jgi:hypothetical protein